MALPTSTSNGFFTGYSYPNLGYSIPDLSYAQNNTLKATATTATTTGNTKLMNVINLIFQYGGQALDILSRTGILKNKNAQTFTADNFDLAAYQNALNSGQLNSAFAGLTPQTPTQNSSKFLGLDFTNPFTWVGVLIFLFGVVYVIKQAKPDPEPTPKNRRK